MDNQKRYQIFISSTYADLSEERGRVIETIIRFDCIPAGIQFFPAMDVDLFEYIKREIDESDYHLLIIGGRYGSMDENGVSWTEREYDYAVSRGIPILAFVHEDFNKLPVNKTDQDDKKRKKLNAFKKKVSESRVVIKYWSNADDLELAVASSLPQVFDMVPRLGWVRANSVVSRESQTEIERQKDSAKLQNEIKKLKENIKGLELDLKKKDEENHTLNSSYQTSQEKNVKYQEEIERLKTSHEELEQSYKKAKEELNILRTERNRLKANQENNQELVLSHENAKKKNIQPENEISDVRAIQKKNQDLEKACQDAQQKIAQLEKEVGDINQNNLELKKLNDDATKEKQQLLNEISKLSENSNNSVLTEENILMKISEAIKEGINSYLLKDKEVDESKPIPSDDIPSPQPGPDNKKRVFISFRLKNEELNIKDEEVASEIQKALVGQGFECCMTSRELNVDTWAPRINKEISKCGVFILVLSKNSYNHNDTNLYSKPDNVVRALALAQRKGKAICVFRIDKSQPDETLMSYLHPYLKDRAIDASENYQEKIQDLIDWVGKIFNILNNQ